MRKNEDQGDQQNDLSQAGQQQTDLRLPQSHEALLAADLKAKGENAGHIDPDGPGGVVCQCCFVGEETGEHPGKQHQNGPGKSTKDGTDCELAAKRFLHPVVIAGAIIVDELWGCVEYMGEIKAVDRNNGAIEFWAQPTEEDSEPIFMMFFPYDAGVIECIV